LSDSRHDLALLRVDHEYRPTRRPLPVETDNFDPPTNQLMETVEYGNTVEEVGRLRLTPAIRLGHVTRMFDATDQLGGPAGADAIIATADQCPMPGATPDRRGVR
jgi:hypothetical protein